MKENQKVIQEAFFRKNKSYADKMKSKFPQYAPQNVKTIGQPGFQTILGPGGGVVNDQREAAKRIVGGLGASVGINSVKNIASKSIKTFPIVISDNIEPETSVMLKKLMEEQYAEYVSLLISNQVIDISQFSSDETEGNIAIQAIDELLPGAKGKQKIARKATQGNLSMDDFFDDISAYNLIRNEQTELKTGIPLMDSLLENAVIMTAENAEIFGEFVNQFSEEVTESLVEATARASRFKGENASEKVITLDQLMGASQDGSLSLTKGKAEEVEEVIDKARGYNPETKKFRKLTSTSVLLNTDELKESLDRSMGEFLLDPKNEIIRDKFEKATFLLQSNRISGAEYIEYLVQRLGIPLSKNVRTEIVGKFKESEVRGPDTVMEGRWGKVKYSNLLSKADIERIATNRSLIRRPVQNMFNTSLASVVGVILSAGVSGAAGYGSAGLLSTVLGFAINPAIVAGGAAFLGALYAIKKLSKKLGQRRSNTEKMFGWERVEYLIDLMEKQRDEVFTKAKRKEEEKEKDIFEANPELLALSGDDLERTLKQYKNDLLPLMKSSKPIQVVTESDLIYDPSTETLQEMEELGQLLEEELANNKEFQAETLLEGRFKIQTSVPAEYKQKYAFDTKKRPELEVVPAFSAKSTYAYGEVEYDKRELKDRRYNAPLMLTVRFKERFADGKFSDNELVAVIGILGVVNRVPSSEMGYILKSNIEGTTLKGILEPGKVKKDTSLIDLFGGKLQKDMQNLPQSGKVWEGLLKLQNLARANQLSGRKNNNVANAHLVFSQKEVDDVKSDTGKDYLTDRKLGFELMKRYSAFTVMVANDASERLYILDDPDNINWEVLPYSAIQGKESGDRLISALTQIKRGR